jgi:threonine aldolase
MSSTNNNNNNNKNKNDNKSSSHIIDSTPSIMSSLTIDLRSDTVTKPTKEMLRQISDLENVELLQGDDVFQDRSLMTEMELKLAEMFGKERCLFVPSGTMANLIAISTHCSERGSEFICGAASHVCLYEQGSCSTLGGAHSRQIPNENDGTMKIEHILDSIRQDDYHFPKTKVVCLEQTHNKCGGKVLKQTYVDEVCDKVKLKTNNEVMIHMDGARIWNACVKNKTSLKDAVKKCDSVSVCLSKAVGAPIGSVILGTDEFIQKCRRLRKALGGGMRQVGILAACANVGINQWEQNVTKSNRLASLFGKQAELIENVKISSVESNLVILSFQNLKKDVSINDIVDWLKKKYGVLVTVFGAPFPFNDPNSIRVAFHYQISEDEVEFAVSSIKVAAWENTISSNKSGGK